LYVEIPNTLASDLNLWLAQESKRLGRKITIKEFVIIAIKENLGKKNFFEKVMLDDT
jgi:hypothetical protein